MATVTLPIAGSFGTVAFTGTFTADDSQLQLVVNNTTINGGGGEAGKFRRVSATQIGLFPYKGNKVMVNGAFVTLPTAGLVGGTTNVMINGTAGQTLAASTTYLVYLTADPALDFRTDGVGHMASPTTGVEVRAASAGTADETRSLIGMVSTDASGQFADNQQQRRVRSWFNDSGITAVARVGNPASVPQSGTYPTFYELILNAQATSPPTGTPVRAYFLLWAGETADLSVSGEAHNEDSSGQNKHQMIGGAFNGQLQPDPTGHFNVPLVGARGQLYSSGATAQWSYGGADSADGLPEGLNYASLWGESESGIGHFGGIDPYRARVRVTTRR